MWLKTLVMIIGVVAVAVGITYIANGTFGIGLALFGAGLLLVGEGAPAGISVSTSRIWGPVGLVILGVGVFIRLQWGL